MLKDSTNSNLISIIMPTYNHGEYIGEAIDSVLNQSYRNFELVIIDNYSSDNTENLVKSYSDHRIKYFKFRNHGIIAASRNMGIRCSTGRYIAFLDSDDIWLPQKLEKQLSLMKQNHEITLSYVLFANLLNDRTIEGEYPEPKQRYRGHIFNQLYLVNSITNSGAMIRREVLNEVGLLDESSELVGVEDADMWLRIAKRRYIDYIKGEVLVLYRARDKNHFYKHFLKETKRRMYIARKYHIDAGRNLYFRKVFLVPLHAIIKRIFKFI